MGKWILSQKFWISHVTEASDCKEMQQREMRNDVPSPFCEAVAGEGRFGIILPLAVIHQSSSIAPIIGKKKKTSKKKSNQ